MTQITFNISQDANPSLIRSILENIKGVLAGSISIRQENETNPSTSDKMDSVRSNNLSHEEFMSKLNSLVKSIDKSAIDYNDEKTKYILSK